MILQTPQETGPIPPPLPMQALAISWEDTVTNQEVLRRSSMPGVEVLIMKAQLRWTGHVMRMEDSCLPNRSALNWLMAPAGRVAKQSATKTPSTTLYFRVPYIPYSVRACDIPVKGWEHLAVYGSVWRLATHNGSQALEERRLSQLDI